MAKKHTEGPWHTDKRKIDGEWIVTVEAPTPIAASLIVCEVGRPNTNTTADARLIAAAPELLAELQALVNAVDEYAEAAARDGEPVYLNVPESAYAAIKKARG